MARESKQDRALRAVREGRVRVVKHTPDVGLSIRYTSDKPDPDTLRRPTYTTAVWLDGNGVVHRSCTCENGQIRPVNPTCGHVWLVEQMFEPEGVKDAT